MLELFPETALVEGGVLSVGGCSAVDLAAEFGTPLLVLCERTIRSRAQAYRAAAPDDALVVFGTKAFPNVALMRLLADEGIGADVSTLGELAFAQAAGIPGERLVFHGNNKSDDELRAAAEAGALVVLDATDEPERAHAAGVRRAMIRLTPGIVADTHTAIRTAHVGSKFGLEANDALAAIREARELGVDVAGVHMHVGSQLTRTEESLLSVDALAAFCARAREELDWTPELVDLGGGLGIAYEPDESPPEIADYVRAVVDRFRAAWDAPARMILEPGRSLVGPAGVTLYEIGVVKRSGDVVYAAIDGGMSDNPRPQFYDARYTALLANRATDAPAGPYRIAGKHCESGDVLIERVQLPEPRRGDLLAVPATGAYTLGMGSNYNGVPRPAAVLAADGRARLVRRRETVDDLLRVESGVA